MPSYQNSPNRIAEPVDLNNLSGWFARELERASHAERAVLVTLGNDLESFVRWPRDALLLCRGWDRRPPPNANTKYFVYLPHIQKMAKQSAKPFAPDTRSNGPAIASFLIAGGERPARFGSANSWSIHHLYSGKFPHFGRQETLHAVRSGAHFTQSAGLVAVHPIADAMADEFPVFAWLLRAHAFRRFGYDPDGVFSLEPDEFGFAGRTYRVIEGPVSSGQDEKFTVGRDTWVMTKKGKGPTFAEKLGLTPEQVEKLCRPSDEPDVIEE